MKRPNRYPYSKKQWIESTVDNEISIRTFQKWLNENKDYGGVEEL